MTPNVTLDDTLENLVERHPAAVAFLMDRGIRCIRCIKYGEPAWGTQRSDGLTQTSPPLPRAPLPCRAH